MNNSQKYMDPEIKDLVQKLLIKDPKLRLGAGPKGIFFKKYFTILIP